MFSKNTIFFFEKLNFYNLIIIFLLKFIFFKNKFYYRNLTEKVENKFLLRVFNLINIEYLNYRKFGYTNFIKNFTSDCVKLTNPVLKKLKREKNYKNIFNFYNLDKDKTDIFDIYLSSSLAGNYLKEGFSSVKLIEYTFGTSSKIYYFPENLGNFLILREKKNQYIKPVIFHLIIKNLIKIFISFFSHKIYKDKKNDKSKVLFCPHKGLYYGNFYKKNFIFKEKYNKKFELNEILVADYDHQCERTKKYYEKFGINEVKFKNFKKINILNIIHFIFKNFTLNFSNFYHICFLIYSFNEIQNSVKFLKNFQNLKAAVFCYDINTNISLILACHILRIKTFSFQERTNSYFFTPYMYFDEYYISGQKIKNIISQNFYSFNNLNVYPLSRTSLIKNYNNEILKKNIICLPPPNINYKIRYNYGDLYSNKKINEFYEIVIKLSKCFSNHTFLIKEKLDTNPLIEEFTNKIKKLDIKNIEVLNHKKSLYKLINKSKILFGSYSSFFDECFTVGKKILLYDKDFYAFDHPFKSSSLYCENFLEVQSRMKLILSDEITDDKNITEIKKNYFPTFKNQNRDVYCDIILKINNLI